MAFYALIAIGVGAALGAWLRWAFGLWLNSIWPELPVGTLSANLIGGFLVGLSVAFFMQHPNLPPEWRLFIITGFLGGLTTFSTFSIETVTLLMRGQYVWALAIITLHLGGCLLMTFIGLQAYKWFHQ
ncbi:MAG: fluoride efflux transporter CrcB [Nitrosomonas sp.]|nr:fluoride efflux transporter CrcB [Nitrosomonas sp.]